MKRTIQWNFPAASTRGNHFVCHLNNHQDQLNWEQKDQREKDIGGLVTGHYGRAMVLGRYLERNP